MKTEIRSVSVFFVLIFLITSASEASPSIQCWGNNSSAQNNIPSGLKLVGLPDQVIDVKTARGLSCVLSASGSISCWGVPTADVAKVEKLKHVKAFSISTGGACALVGGQVKCFSAMSDSSFEAVPALNHPTQISVGGNYGCAQDNTGIHCWGSNTAVAQVPPLSHPTKFVAGPNDVCALDDTGIVCWGDAQAGIENLPYLIAPTDFFLGFGYACAQDQNGLECWGSSQTIPAVPSSTSHPQYVSGQNHICGLDASGVQCWGDDSFGQLNIPALSHPTKLFADPTSEQTCALDDSGLVCWGENQAGQSALSPVSSLTTSLGNTCAAVQGQIQCWGDSSSNVDSPLPIADSYQVSLGLNFGCALDVGNLSMQACWGNNPDLQSLTPTLPLVDFSSGNQVQTALPLFTIGQNHLCLNSAGQSSCFGNNDFGQSKIPANFQNLGAEGTLSAGGNHTCGIDLINGVECWGENESGESTPPTTLVHPTQVVAGQYHSCALDDNGVTCWGRSTEGQTTVPPLSHPRVVQAGGYHSCALDDHGVTCWGDDSFSQTTIPKSLSGLGRKITTLATGIFNTCVATQ